MSDERRHSQDQLLARLDERTGTMVEDIKDIKAFYVTRREFNPVKKIVYSLVTLIMSGVIYALLNTVIKHG